MSPSTPAAGTPANGQPTVVLVHGAFADASGWYGVIDVLQNRGIAVVAVPNPLRGVSLDAAYVAARVQAIEGPVVLVGHSYGGAVITVAGDMADNVAGLVYTAAFAPDTGETLLDINGRFTDNLLGPALVPATVPVTGSAKTQTEFSIAIDQFHAVFCADLPADMANHMALTQRPATDTTFGEPAPSAAWHNLPSWYAVSTKDRAIDPAGQRFMAKRAGSTTIEIDGASHVGFMSHAKETADLIATAVNTVG